MHFTGKKRSFSRNENDITIHIEIEEAVVNPVDLSGDCHSKA